MWEMIERMATDLSWIHSISRFHYLVRHFCFGLKIQKWLHGQWQSLINIEYSSNTLGMDMVTK